MLNGEVQLTEALGSEVMVHFAVEAPPAITDEVRELAKDAGAEGLGTPAQEDGNGRSWSGASEPVRSASKGDSIKVAVDTRSLHFFDRETGLGIYDESERKGA